MSVWVEAHDLPHADGFGKKIAWLPVVDYRFGKHTDAFREEGSITLPTSYSRLGDVLHVDPSDHLNDVGSVLHYYMRDVLGSDSRPIPIGSIVAERKPVSLGEKATGTTQISGRGLTSYFLDRFRLLPYDYPTNPTVQGNWTFGAPDDGGMLVNGDFETTPLENGGFETGDLTGWGLTEDDGDGPFDSATAVVSFDPGGADTGDYYASVVPTDPDSGLRRSIVNVRIGDQLQFTIRVRAASGARLRAGVSDTNLGLHTNAYEESGYWWAEVANAAEGAGSTTGAWQTITLNVRAVAESVELVITYAGGAAIIDFDVDSVILSADNQGTTPWYPVKPANTVFFEWYNGLVDTGSGAARFQVYDQVYVNPYNSFRGMGTAGVSQDVTMTVGTRYTASIRVRQDSGNPQRYVLVFFRRTLRGAIGSPGSSYMSSVTVTVPTNTWTTIELSAIADVNDVAVQLRWLSDEDPYAVATTDRFLGPITFIDNAKLFEGEGSITIGDLWTRLWDTRIDYIVPTFDETNDSNGDPWDTERSFELTENQTYGQIAEDFQRVWRYVHRIRYDREDNLYYFDVFNPGYVAEDWTLTNTGTITVGMNIIDGELVSRSPAATRFRVKGADGTWVDAVDPDLETNWGVADGSMDARNIAASADLSNAGDTALEVNEEQMVTFETMMTDHGSFVPLRDFDIFHNVMVNLGASSGVPKTNRIVTSIVISGKPGLAPDFAVFVNSDAFASTGAAALAEAVRRLLRRSQRDNRLRPLPTGGASGSEFTVTIAASNATEDEKAKADLRADGVDDLGLIETALARAVDGVVVLSSGSFVIPDPGFLTLTNGNRLEGQGEGTIIEAENEITMTDGSTLKHMRLHAYGTQPMVLLVLGGVVDDLLITEGGPIVS